MAEKVLTKLSYLTRKRYQQLITEMVHKRDLSRKMAQIQNLDVSSFQWRYYLRYALDPSEKNKSQQLKIKIGNAQFDYGYEYLGIPEKLV